MVGGDVEGYGKGERRLFVRGTVHSYRFFATCDTRISRTSAGMLDVGRAPEMRKQAIEELAHGPRAVTFAIMRLATQSDSLPRHIRHPRWLLVVRRDHCP